ncbi:MAG: NAD-dependent epimerase/dehydratase family protein [Chloroflexi bacterium]|nr:NAD-dependent epimerase/dehydratase family protein [Chloroflexota bacterium]
MVDNLYGYGPTHGAPIREDLPMAAEGKKGRARATVAKRLLDAHQAGDFQVTIARGSDYFGPGGTDSLVGERFFAPILAGATVRLIGDPDAPHTVTYIPDFARALIELARQDEAYGAAWHVPSAPAVSTRRLAHLTAAAAGAPAPRVSRVPRPMLRLIGVFSPSVRELSEMMYEFEEPYVVDDQRIRQAFGLAETPLGEALALTAGWWRDHLSAGLR